MMDEIGLILQSLQVIFPHHFPKDKDGMKALILVWTNDLQHIPLPVLKAAAGHLRRNEDFPTIAAMYRSIRAVIGLTSKREVQREIDNSLAETTYSMEGFSPVARMVFESLGGRMGIMGLNATAYDIALTREYETAANEHFGEIILPENAGKLKLSEKVQFARLTVKEE